MPKKIWSFEWGKHRKIIGKTGKIIRTFSMNGDLIGKIVGKTWKIIRTFSMNGDLIGKIVGKTWKIIRTSSMNGDLNGEKRGKSDWKMVNQQKLGLYYGESNGIRWGYDG